jgi:hypothetical protein
VEVFEVVESVASPVWHGPQYPVSQAPVGPVAPKLITVAEIPGVARGEECGTSLDNTIFQLLPEFNVRSTT